MTPPPPTSAGKPRPRIRGSGGRAVLPLVPGFERTPTRTRPLPDAAAVRLVVVPDSAPPFDDGRAVSPAGRREPPEPLRARERLGVSLPNTPEPGSDRHRGRQAQTPPWPPAQARRLIRQLGPMLAAGPVPRVRRVLASQPAEGVVEMTVVVGCGPRIRALAVRLEQDRPHRGGRGRGASTAGWVCTAIEAA